MFPCFQSMPMPLSDSLERPQQLICEICFVPFNSSLDLIFHKQNSHSTFDAPEYQCGYCHKVCSRNQGYQRHLMSCAARQRMIDVAPLRPNALIAPKVNGWGAMGMPINGKIIKNVPTGFNFQNGFGLGGLPPVTMASLSSSGEEQAALTLSALLQAPILNGKTSPTSLSTNNVLKREPSDKSGIISPNSSNGTFKVPPEINGNFPEYTRNVSRSVTPKFKDSRSATPPAGESYTCEHCGRAFPRKAHLGSHLRAHRIRRMNEEGLREESRMVDDDYECDVCNEIFSRPDKLSAHMREEHYKPAETSNFGRLPYNIPTDWSDTEHLDSAYDDDYTSSVGSERTAKIHSINGSPSEEFPCKFCNQLFLSTRARRRHVAKHHRERPSMSSSSQSPSTSPSSPSHSPQSPSSQSHSSQSHSLAGGTESGETDRVFDGSGFSSDEDDDSGELMSLGSYRRSDGGRGFECRVCFRVLSRKDALTRHMKIHQGARPHVCELCARRFFTRDQLRAHLRTHPPVEGCQVCKERFATRAQLEEHLYSHARELDALFA
eukprot:256743_1